ncbi:MAG: hypothetical protein AB2637_13195 [Candidatus Thiodiazotropha sp.]
MYIDSIPVAMVKVFLFKGLEIEQIMEGRLSLRAVVASLSCLIGTGAFAAGIDRRDSGSGFIPTMPFSGVLVEYNRNNPNLKTETRLILSEQGMRSETKTNRFGSVKIVFIRNHQTGQDWLVDPKKGIYSELPRGTLVASNEDATGEWTHRLGVLANRPCVGLNGSKQSSSAVGDSELSIWRCNDEHGQAYLQHFSTLLGVVVRQESHDGWISVLRDIALVNRSSDHIIPSEDYREVSLSELIMGEAELPDYVE